MVPLRATLARALRAFVRDRHAIAVALITAAFAVLYSLIGLVEHLGHRTALIDLGIYDQAARAYAELRAPRVPLFGLRTPTDLGLLHWTDHVTPILALVAPFYWLHDGPETLLVVHGALFALAIPALWIFARRAIGLVAAYLVAVGFGLFWPIQHALFTPFHQVAFAVPLLAWMLERYQAGQHRHAALAALSLLAVREDLGLVVFVFGVLLVARGERKLGGAVAVGGLLFVWFATSLLIPLMGGSPRRDWSYWHFGRNPFDLALSLVKSPLAALEYALTPAVKVHTLLWLLAPLLFLPIKSRLALLALPLLATRMLSGEPNYWGVAFHYNAFVAPILVCAAVDAASRLPRPPFRSFPGIGWGVIWAAAYFVLELVTLPQWPAWRLTDASWWYPRTAEVKAAQAALARIPNGAFVAAANTAGIHITRRAKVILWVPHGDRRGVEAVWKLDGMHWSYLGDRKLAEAPWVLADVHGLQFPFPSVEAQMKAVQQLEERGYRPVFNEGGFVVLYREPRAGE